MEKMFNITYINVTLWLVFNTNISYDKVMIFQFATDMQG